MADKDFYRILTDKMKIAREQSVIGNYSMAKNKYEEVISFINRAISTGMAKANTDDLQIV